MTIETTTKAKVDVTVLDHALETLGVLTSSRTLLLCAASALVESYDRHLSLHVHSEHLLFRYRQMKRWQAKRDAASDYKRAQANTDEAYQRCVAQYEMLVRMLLLCSDNQRDAILTILGVSAPTRTPNVA